MKIALAMAVAALCWFVLVIAYGWVMHGLPSSGMIPLFLLGLTVVGAVFGLVICAAANVILRIGPPKLRAPLSAVVWVVCVATFVKLLVSGGADPQRTLIAAAITAACGLLIGPYYAELFVGLWFLKRLQRRQSSCP